MSDHDKSDAFDFIRTDVQRRLRLYKRRIQKEAETEYESLVAENLRLFPDRPLDHIFLAEQALNNATKNWLGIETAPRPVLEAGDGSQAA